MFLLLSSKHDFHTVEWNGALIRAPRKFIKEWVFVCYGIFINNHTMAMRANDGPHNLTKRVGIGLHAHLQLSAACIKHVSQITLHKCKPHLISTQPEPNEKTIRTKVGSNLFILFSDCISKHTRSLAWHSDAARIYFWNMASENWKKAPKHRKQYELIRIKVEWESCWHVASMPVLLLRLMLCFERELSDFCLLLSGFVLQLGFASRCSGALCWTRSTFWIISYSSEDKHCIWFGEIFWETCCNNNFGQQLTLFGWNVKRFYYSR